MYLNTINELIEEGLFVGDDFSTKSMHLFDATYTDGLKIEVQVNSNDFASSPA